MKMGRGSGGSLASQVGGGLVLECHSESLSDSQLTKVRTVHHDLAKLRKLLKTVPQSNRENGVPLVNGTASAAAANPTPTSSVPAPVGLQMPQFLLLQNGQMLAATSSPLATSTVPANTSSSPMVASAVQMVQSSGALPSLSSKPPQRGPNILSRTLRTPKSSSAGTTSVVTSVTTTTTPSGSSPEIQVLHEGPTTSSSLKSAVCASVPNAAPGGGGSNRSLPVLNVVARPKQNLSPAMAMAQRKELDAKVKSVLVKSAQEFVEYLLREGLIRTSQQCAVHKLSGTQAPIKLKLGMFTDPKILSTSGGYVWISECCGKRYVSVYSGSIFGSTPIDKVAPSCVLKLMYHWACQTSISNVESWVKVERNFISKMYQYLRCVCSVMLQDKVYDFGFDSTTVELGIVSLGTSTADGSKKAVKVEILGLYDRKMKSYRLFASEPEPGTSSRQRFVRILKPVEQVVNVNAILLCDQSVDRNVLHEMHYAKVSVCDASDNEENLQSNARIMAYLRRHVPKMFQSSLSQLSLQQVQLVLDELCWRERFGNCAAQAYNNLAEHITYLTAREAENPGVLHLLDYVAASPQNNWRYKSQLLPLGPTSLQPSIILNTTSAPTISQQQMMAYDITASQVQSPLEHLNKVPLGSHPPGSVGDSQKVKRRKNLAITPPPDAVELEPFYYCQVAGDPSLGRDENTHNFSCHLCHESCADNIKFYNHLKVHLKRSVCQVVSIFMCNYCIEDFSSREKRDTHERQVHKHLTSGSVYVGCRICSETFTSEYVLVNHMAKKHYEVESPYRCEVCNYCTSIYHQLIDHFSKEHFNTPYVQCHFCLMVKSVNSLSINTFSQRMFQHMQKHLSMQGKCKLCGLSFYSKYLHDEHTRKDHVSRIMSPGMQRFKAPLGQTHIMFRPWIKKPAQQVVTPPSVPDKGLYGINTVAISATISNQTKLVINFPGIDPERERSYYCIECDANLNLEHHFRAYRMCTRCSYATCCRNMISKHSNLFHPYGGRGRRVYYNLGNPIHLPKPLYCICGFSSKSGNHLARHLGMCEGGRKSAYPSVMDAMIYQGDHLTGSSGDTLDLARLASMGTINESSLDMSHFMSMTME